MGLRIGAVLACVTLVAAAGCASGNLTEQWPAMPEPKAWTPEVGTCHSAYSEVVGRAAYTPVSCDQTHGYEIAYVGTFGGSPATPPTRNNPDWTKAWSECDTKTSEYVGGPWRDAKLWIGVSVPNKGNWDGGARWFMCMAGTTSHKIGNPARSTDSVQGVLADAGTDLRRACFQIPDDEDTELEPKSCTTGHNAEYVGYFISNDTWDALDANLLAAHVRCRSLIAAYVGLPDDDKLHSRTGSSYTIPSRRDWDDGDHGVRCHLWHSERTFTSSLKGAGTSALPIG